MSTSRIWKTLPNGKKVHRYVTRDEYIGDGWASNGWATNILEWQQAADEAILDQTLKTKFFEEDTRTLDLYSKQVNIVKQLPNGKWKTLTMPYGQYETQGWKNNGWRLAGRLQHPHFPTSKKTRSQAIKKLKQQSWWKPKRSHDQARMLSPTKTSSEISLLTNIDNIPNPAYRTWARRHTGKQPPTIINRYKAYKTSIPKLSKKNKNESYENWALRHDLYSMTRNPYNFWV